MLLLPISRQALIASVFCVALVCLPRWASAQEELVCGTETPDGYLAPHQRAPEAFARFKAGFAERLQKRGTQQRLDSLLADTVAVNVYIFRRNDGTGGLTDAELAQAMAKLNADYDSVGLYFAYCQPQYISSNKYYDFRQEDETDLRDAYYSPDGLNIYFANSIRSRSGGGLCGYAYYPYFGRNVILMQNGCTMNGSTLSHEVGHAYGLPHTHGFTNGELTDELVDGSNCATSGDEFCDTPADPQLSTLLVDENCLYSGTAVDTNMQAFKPDVNNHMSYSRASCRVRFSMEQMAAMKFNSGDAFDRIDLKCDTFTGDFTVQNLTTTQFCRDSAVVRLVATSSGATGYQWDVNADGSIDGTDSVLVYRFAEAGSYSVVLRMVNAREVITRFKRNVVTIGPRALPVVQSFDPDVIVDDYFWRYGSGVGEASWVPTVGRTPSADTGPSDGRAADSGDAGYLYVEASGQREGTPAIYQSGCIEIPGSDTLLDGDSLRFARPVLSFYYHMYGRSMGELHLDLVQASQTLQDITEPLIGEQQTDAADTFRVREVDMTAFAGQTVQLSFRGLVGSGFRSDMAIDDVTLSMRSQVIVGVGEAVSFAEVPRLFPNPASRSFAIQSLPDASTVSVRDALGRVVIGAAPYAGPIIVDQLPSGFYTVTVVAERGQAHTLQLVVL